MHNLVCLTVNRATGAVCGTPLGVIADGLVLGSHSGGGGQDHRRRSGGPIETYFVVCERCGALHAGERARLPTGVLTDRLTLIQAS